MDSTILDIISKSFYESRTCSTAFYNVGYILASVFLHTIREMGKNSIFVVSRNFQVPLFNYIILQLCNQLRNISIIPTHVVIHGENGER